MLAAQQNAQIINANLPKVTTTARQARILANAAPTLWLKPDSAYFALDANGNCAAWYDAANPRSFVPVGNSPPSVTALVNSANSFLTFAGAGSPLFDATLDLRRWRHRQPAFQQPVQPLHQYIDGELQPSG